MSCHPPARQIGLYRPEDGPHDRRTGALASADLHVKPYAKRHVKVYADRGSVDLEAAELLILRNLFQAAGRLVEKDTKTHAARRLALSDDSVGLLEEHRRRCAERAEACGVRLSKDAYVFSFDPAGRQPMHPDSVTHRFSRLAKQLGVRTRLHDLRHYAATQLIAGGVDLRTVSGRIGHAGGGATTLRVYTHFLAAADRQAAEVLEKTLRRPRRSSSES
jgi:integrase